MRPLHFFILIGAAFSIAGCTEVPTPGLLLTSLTTTQPLNPVSSKPGGPVITSVTAIIVSANRIIPEFHFIAPNGNAVMLHREIVASTSPTNNRNFNPTALIDVNAQAQKQGAIFSGGWGCGTDRYFTTVKAYMLDSDGNRSNEVQYTVHCNGG